MFFYNKIFLYETSPKLIESFFIKKERMKVYKLILNIKFKEKIANSLRKIPIFYYKSTPKIKLHFGFKGKI